MPDTTVTNNSARICTLVGSSGAPLGALASLLAVAYLIKPGGWKFIIYCPRNLIQALPFLLTSSRAHLGELR